MEEFLKEYLSVLRLERNLSENTILSYKNDLTSLLNFLEQKNIDDPSQVSIDHITFFFNSLNKLDLSSTTSARYFSSIKGFFNYLSINKYIKDNPLERISAPKLSKNLPVVLTVEEINSIINLPDTNTNLGLRDKALLELLYACGTRVTEIINLKVSEL